MQQKIFTVTQGKDSITVPYFEFGDSSDPKSIFISGGVHGDEVNGIFGAKVAADLLSQLEKEKKLSGRVILFPILNPLGFQLGKRKVPLDNKDLNRQFGVQAIDTISEKFAHQLTEEFLSSVTMGIDFHDAGGGSKLLPHTRIHLDDANDCVSCSRELAGYFGLPYMLERKGRSNMLAVALNNLYDTPVITVEVGGSRELEPVMAQISKKGVRNILIANSIIEGELDLPKNTYVVYRRILLKSKYSGVIRFEKQLGDRVSENDLIAMIYDPIGAKDIPIKAPKGGILFSQWPNNLITDKSAIATFVCLDDEKAVEEIDMPEYSVESFEL